MMRSTANATPESGAVTSIFCLTPDRREQRLIGWARTSLVSAALSASVSMPYSPNGWENAA